MTKTLMLATVMFGLAVAAIPGTPARTNVAETEFLRSTFAEAEFNRVSVAEAEFKRSTFAEAEFNRVIVAEAEFVRSSFAEAEFTPSSFVATV